MRRSLLPFVFLLAVFLQLPANATARHHHSQVAASHVHRGAHATARRHARMRKAILIQQGARHVASLKTDYTAPNAVIDPVPRDPVPKVNFRIPPALKGTYASLVRQNVRAEADGLERIQDDEDLLALRHKKELLPIPASGALTVDPRLPANRRYCRPWTARFLSNVARVHAARFHRPLQVNSAVRTVAYQRHLEAVNGNAAPAEGDVASPHLTGASVDIAKKGLSASEVGWMRAYLLPLQMAGKLDVEEEFQQACFHITVYKAYAPPTAPHKSPNPRAPHHSAANTELLATQVR
jgi:hypothetical protein